MESLYQTVVVKMELSLKAKLLVFRAAYIPTHTYGHELWITTERMRSQVQAAERSFLRRVAGLTLHDRVTSSAIRERLKVEVVRAPDHLLVAFLWRCTGHDQLGQSPEVGPGLAGEIIGLGTARGHPG